MLLGTPTTTQGSSSSAHHRARSDGIAVCVGLVLVTSTAVVCLKARTASPSHPLTHRTHPTPCSPPPSTPSQPTRRQRVAPLSPHHKQHRHLPLAQLLPDRHHALPHGGFVGVGQGGGAAQAGAAWQDGAGKWLVDSVSEESSKRQMLPHPNLTRTTPRLLTAQVQCVHASGAEGDGLGAMVSEAFKPVSDPHDLPQWVGVGCEGALGEGVCVLEFTPSSTTACPPDPSSP